MTLDPVYNTGISGTTRVIVMTLGRIARNVSGGIVAVALTTCFCTLAQTRSGPVDPGVRGGPAGAGAPLKGLTADEIAFFQDGQARFAEVEVVAKGSNNGLGPRFNSNQCLSCHSQPAGGGSSPAQNPLLAVAHLNGAKNTVPWFIVENGPVREARFKKSNGAADGEVHDIFVITGRSDAPVATSLNSISCLREIRCPATVGMRTLFFASRLLYLAQGS
jgi:hypothetical protein